MFTYRVVSILKKCTCKDILLIFSASDVTKLSKILKVFKKDLSRRLL